MKNTLADLNNALFEQIERLQDDSLSADQLAAEIQRSAAVKDIAGTIIQNANLAFNVMKHRDEYGYEHTALPTMLESKS